MKKTLIIGGSGFIGSHFHKSLSSESIVNLDLVAPTFPHQSTYIQGDVRKIGDLYQALAQHPEIDTIIHLAAEHRDFGISKAAYFKTNEYGTKMVCTAASKFDIKNIVFYSSVAVYGNTAKPATEKTPVAPESHYGESKLLAEYALNSWASKGQNRKVLIFRPTVIYGERNVANMYRLIKQISKGNYFHIGQGNNIKSIIYVKNIVAATLFLMERMQKGLHIYNYADEKQLTSREIANTISDALGKSQAFTLPYPLVYALGLPFDLAIKLTGKNLPISTNRIKKFCTPTHYLAEKIAKTNFIAPYSNKEGLQNMVRWMQQKETSNKDFEKELVFTYSK